MIELVGVTVRYGGVVAVEHAAREKPLAQAADRLHRAQKLWGGGARTTGKTTGKTTLLGIGKRGNPCIRRLLIHGARSCLMHLDRSRDQFGAWLDQLRARMHPNKVVVALAAKMARRLGDPEQARGTVQAARSRLRLSAPGRSLRGSRE